ncbi:hypothetical protein TRICI_003306 [Trichomonascus ciferrii]|uniref:F-box domain-containing protein n=1 Tax=Trichomonascus ciferrii TaxID=44093 RepID=A0A642V4E3_9ASCO|nr:hypothetical protein TRICI_003306 [Trichomonascus ciferrii]
MSGLETLPCEVLMLICEDVSVNDALMLRETCKRFKELISPHLEFSLTIIVADLFQFEFRYMNKSWLKILWLSKIYCEKEHGLDFWFSRLRLICASERAKLEVLLVALELLDVISHIPVPPTDFTVRFRCPLPDSVYNKIVGYTNNSSLQFDAELYLDLKPFEDQRFGGLIPLGEKFKKVSFSSSAANALCLSLNDRCRLDKLVIDPDTPDEVNSVQDCLRVLDNYSQSVHSVDLRGIGLTGADLIADKLVFTQFSVHREKSAETRVVARSAEARFSGPWTFFGAVTAFGLSITTTLKLEFITPITFACIPSLFSILVNLTYCDLSLCDDAPYSLIFDDTYNKPWSMKKLRLRMWPHTSGHLPCFKGLKNLEALDLLFHRAHYIPEDMPDYTEEVTENCPTLTRLTVSVRSVQKLPNVESL